MAKEKFVQSYILNHQMAKSLQEAKDYFDEVGCIDPFMNIYEWINVEEEDYLDDWTAPRWGSKGDIAFFMYASTAHQWTNKLYRQLYDSCETNMSFGEFRQFLYGFDDDIDNFGLDLNRGKYHVYTELEYPGHKRKQEIDPVDGSIVIPADAFDGFRKATETIIERVIKTDDVNTLLKMHGGSVPEVLKYSFKDIVPAVKSRADKGELQYIYTNTVGVTDLITYLIWAENLQAEYAGKIVALGILSSVPENINLFDKSFHWNSPIYGTYENMVFLEHPVDISEIRDYITITRQGTVTPVQGDSFERLINQISQKNKLPKYFRECKAVPQSLYKLNDENWLQVAGKYRYKFLSEDQFRIYYVNKLLTLLADKKKEVYRECRCITNTRSNPRPDNVILFDGLYLPVEVKLNIKNEKDLPKQCKQYCDALGIELNPQKTILSHEVHPFVLIIDRNMTYLYDHKSHQIKNLLTLDDLKKIDDILNLKQCIINEINN